MPSASSGTAYVFAASQDGSGHELWLAGPGLSEPRLLRDIKPGPGSADPADFTPLADGRLLFVADDGLHGRELWVTDGTKAGTRLFHDFMPGGAGSAPDIVGVISGGALLTVDAAHGARELWITDGTPEGTRMLAGPAFGEAGTTLLDFNRMADGQWLFVAKDPDNNQDVWVTDGTAEGTRILAGIPVKNGALARDIMLSPDGQDAYVIDGNLIWRTDGTAGGTNYLGGGVAPLNGGTWLDTDRFDGSKYVNFVLRDGASEGGTRLFKPFGEWSITSFGDERSLIYSAQGLTVTDGTAEGTRHYFDGVSYYPSMHLADFMSLGDGRILFTEMLGGLGTWDSAAVWVTDGTTGGTYQIGTRSADLPKSLPDSFTRLDDGGIVFSAPSFNDPNAAWRLDAGLGSIEPLAGAQFSAGTTFHALTVSTPSPKPHQWSERLPHFDIAHYLENNPDVAASGMDPLEHFLRFGGQEGRSPNAGFDSAFYRAAYPDVAGQGGNPFLHYLAYGRQEGRQPNDGSAPPVSYPEIGAEALAAIARALLQEQAGADPAPPADRPPSPHPAAPLVDSAFYLAAYGDVAQAGVEAAEHYMAFGWREERDPNALFDTSFYLGSNPDVRAAGVNAMTHYLEFGGREGRDPSARFDSQAYLDSNPDVAAAGMNPLAHYLAWGMMEGREIFPA